MSEKFDDFATRSVFLLHEFRTNEWAIVYILLPSFY